MKKIFAGLFVASMLMVSASFAVVCKPSRAIYNSGFNLSKTSARINYIAPEVGNPNRIRIQGRTSSTGSLFDKYIDMAGVTFSGTWGTLNGYGYVTEIVMTGLSMSVKGYTGASSFPLSYSSRNLAFGGNVSFAFSSLFASNINSIIPYPQTVSVPGITIGDGVSTSNSTLVCY